MRRTLITALASALLVGCGVAPVAMQPVSLPAVQRIAAADEPGMTDGQVYLLTSLGATSYEAANLIPEGIHTAADMLRAGATLVERQRLSAKTGIPQARILKWVNYADLMRITGVGPRYSFLLEAAGVDTVAELALRNPTTLNGMLRQANQKSLVDKLPSADQVTTWVHNAKTMPHVVQY